MKHIYVFDLDGTLADCTHRLHLLEDKKDKDRWGKFYEQCTKDKPILPIMSIFEMVVNESRWGPDALILTGRPEAYREKTIDWLIRNVELLPDWTQEREVKISDIRNFFDRMLYMRKDGDHRPDYVIKKEWLDSYPHKDRIAIVFEDRKQVVDMWRENGILCCQTKEGNF